MRIYIPYIVACCLACWLTTFDLRAQCNLSATSSGSNAAYTQLYVLVNAAGAVVAQNNTGTFLSVAPGVYHIHALNYDPANPPSPLPVIGQQVSSVGTVTAGCANADFLTDFVTRSCASCSQTRTVCVNDPLVVSTSGENAAYTQLYVMVDAATGLIVTTSLSGVFTGTIAAGHSYQIYALNYDPANPPNPLPIAGQSVNAVGTVSAGCYNSDYLTDYLCYNVTACATTCFRSSNLCAGQNIVVSTSGENSAYEQVFVLTDAAGNFVAQNTTGVFSTAALSGTDYRVYALNFNATNPPSPLPSGMSVGTPISTIAGGCFNSDFLTDYLCFNINCTLLGDDILSFSGEKVAARNRLDWTINQPQDVVSFVLERSANGYAGFQALGSISATSDHSYTFWDELPLPSSYYRLRVQFNDGHHAYSSLVFLERAELPYKDIRIYPNPTDNQINIDFESTDTEGMSLLLYNVLGQELATQFYTVQMGTNRLQLDLSEYASGVYMLILKNNAWQQAERIIKE